LKLYILNIIKNGVKTTVLKTIVSFFSVVVLIMLISFFFLLKGITVDKISYENININEMYLKYDEKFILTINKLEIKKKKKKKNPKATFDKSYIKIANDILKYFRLIEINSIIYNNQITKIKYSNNIFSIKNQGLNFNITANLKDSKIYYKINSDKIDNIKFLDKFIVLKPEIHDILFNKLSFENIKLDTFSGIVDLKNIDKFDLNSLFVSFIVEKPKFKLTDKHTAYFENIEVKLKSGILDIQVHKVKDFHKLTFQGHIDSKIDKLSLNLLGDIFYKDIKLKTTIDVKNSILNYDFSSNFLKNIKTVEEFVPLSRKLKVWIVERLEVKNLKLLNATGILDLNNRDIDLSTLKVNLILNNAILDFNPKKTSPLKTEKVFLNFNGKNLTMKFKNPSASGIKLNKSSATIYNLLDGNSGLRLNLQTKSAINRELVQLVKSYHILPNDFNIIQINGTSIIHTVIDIPFSSNPITAFVEIKNQKSDFNIYGNSVKLNNLDFTYKNKKILIKNLKANYKDFVLNSKKLTFDTNNKKLIFDLNIHNKNDKLVDIEIVNNSIFKQNKFYGKVDVKSLSYSDLLVMKNEILSYSLFYDKGLNILLPMRYITYKKDENNLSIINIKNLKLLNKYIPKYNLPKGSLKLKTKNFKDISLQLKTDLSSYNIFYKKEKVDDIVLDAEIRNMKLITVKDNIGLIKSNIILSKKPIINIALNNMDIKYKTDTNNSEIINCETKIINLPSVNLYLKNGSFEYNNKLLKYKKLKIKTNNDQIDINLDNNSTKIELNIKNKNILLDAKELDSEFVNNLFEKEVINSGFINLKVKGTQCLLEGNIKIKDVNIKDATILNNILLVANSAPTLINPLLVAPNLYRFASGGFMLREYKIEEGSMNVKLNRGTNILNLNNINIQGVSSNFYGTTFIDLSKKQIDAKLNVAVIQDYSKIISYIPVAGYILLGKDKNFSYSVDVTGDLENPNISTNLISDTSTAPYHILKRLIFLPLQLFNDENE